VNRQRRYEAGKIFLDLSKYLATTVAIGGFFNKDVADWITILMGSLVAFALFFIGIKTIPPDKEN
jgi:hypothetical protein